MTIYYQPDDVPTDLQGIINYLRRDRIQLMAIINAIASGQIEELNVAPTKPRTGQVKLADGTNWNPGSGQGVYCYYGGAWNKL